VHCQWKVAKICLLALLCLSLCNNSWTSKQILHKIWYCKVLIKFVERFQFGLKPDINNDRLPWILKPTCVSVLVTSVTCYTSILIGAKNVGFEVFTAMVMKSIIFWDMTPRSLLSCNRSFWGTYRLHLQGRRNNCLPPAYLLVLA
jgi:hypothetical protein